MGTAVFNDYITIKSEGRDRLQGRRVEGGLRETQPSQLETPSLKFIGSKASKTSRSSNFRKENNYRFSHLKPDQNDFQPSLPGQGAYHFTHTSYATVEEGFVPQKERKYVVNAEVPTPVPESPANEQTPNTSKIEEIQRSLESLRVQIAHGQIPPERLQNIRNLVIEQQNEVKRLTTLESDLSDMRHKLSDFQNQAVQSLPKAVFTRKVEAVADNGSSPKNPETRPVVEVLPAVTRTSAKREGSVLRTSQASIPAFSARSTTDFQGPTIYKSSVVHAPPPPVTSYTSIQTPAFFRSAVQNQSYLSQSVLNNPPNVSFFATPPVHIPDISRDNFFDC
jgi:hypothetical protein